MLLSLQFFYLQFYYLIIQNVIFYSLPQVFKFNEPAQLWRIYEIKHIYIYDYQMKYTYL